MKIRKILSAVFGAVAVCAAGLALWLSFSNMNSAPILLSPPEEAEARVTGFMDAVCQADYEHMSEFLYGNPSLGLDREPADKVGKLLWEAYTDSLTYELIGECTATDSGLAQKVSLTGLDISTVTAVLKERSQVLLEKRVAEAENARDVYDDHNEYREDFVMEVLYDAAGEALKEDAEEQTVEFILRLSFQDGHWMIVTDSELLDAISGGILY